jgi:D-alanyl-D-alanine carboxypeptidase (penicillin-binding protein 5/6)
MYRLQKIFRTLKIAARQTDRTQILRTAGILLVAVAVLGTAPQKTDLAEGQEEPEIQGVEEENSAGDLPAGEASFSEPRSDEGSRARLFPSPAPEASVSAQAAYFIDNQTEAVLYEKNPDQRLPMASLTKIMTALVVLENFQLDEIIAVPEVCADLPPNEMGLASNEKINVEGLLYGMLVASGSDAACALSHHFDGKFLELMNKKAQELGLTQTHFENETGLDDENGSHLSTARDIVKLSKEALKDRVFGMIMGTRQVNIPNSDQTCWHGLVSTNELLFTLPGTTGIKTGYTAQAKGCLAISYERDGREIIGVVLGSDDRFADAKTVLDWIFE